ncbi:MAG TPA: peptide chain release factor N(5)-glutamine methyltransferase [Mucilaginibacter sp.]|nr:peptide chain release factor N(5)-glutamine methyltransferase [Mucilaginibacter sp.]
MQTVRDVSASFRKELSVLYDAPETDSLCAIVLNEVTGISTAMARAFTEQELTNENVELIGKMLDELKSGKPIQYIIGHAEFYGLTFKVNPSVLIPRPETEELVSWVIDSANKIQIKKGNILDIGTGSGCIAVSLKKNLPETSVSAIDVSPEALQTAQENAELNKAEVNFIKADILNIASSNPGLQTSGFNIIVSNPPYVTTEDRSHMHINVTEFEPHTALFVPEDDPLIFYRSIADFAFKNLVNVGLLFFEINESYGEQIVELLVNKRFINIELRKDISDKNRMIKAVKP